MSNLETASRSLIEAHQLARLQLGLSRMLPANRFYQEKLAGKESGGLKFIEFCIVSLMPVGSAG